MAASLLGFATAACFNPESFICTDPAECRLGGSNGACEVDGRCTYDDESCDRGRRFGPYARSAAGACVGSNVETIVIEADLSRCRGPDELTVDLCRSNAGPGPERVDVDLKDQDTDSEEASRAYIRFPAVAEATVLSVRLEATVPPDEEARSDSKGSVVAVSPFDLQGLMAAEPQVLGDPLSQESGAADPGQVVQWELPRTVLGETSTHLGICPESEDNVQYWGASTDDPPRLVVEIDG